MAGLTPTTLLSPEGELETWLFPADSPATLNARLQGYLTAGAVLALSLAPEPADVDAVVRDYAYWRAYDAVVLRLSADPSKQEFANQGKQEWSKEQFAAMVARRDGKAALLPAGMIPTASGTVVETEGYTTIPMPLVSRQVDTYIRWPR